MREWEEQHAFDEASAEAAAEMQDFLDLTGKLMDAMMECDNARVAVSALAACVSAIAAMTDDPDDFYTRFHGLVEKNGPTMCQVINAMRHGGVQ